MGPKLRIVKGGGNEAPPPPDRELIKTLSTLRGQMRMMGEFNALNYFERAATWNVRKRCELIAEDLDEAGKLLDSLIEKYGRGLS